MRGDYLGRDMTVLLMSAIEQTGEGIAVVDLSGTILYLNGAFARMHGYESTQLLGMNLSVFHEADQMPAVNRANKKVMEEGSFIGQIMHRHRDGKVFPTSMHSCLVRDHENRPIGIVATVRDTTDITDALSDLSESRLFAEKILDSIPDVIGIQDTNHDVIMYNSSGYRFVGMAPEEVKGRKCFQLIGRSKPCEQCATSATYKSHKPERVVKLIPEMGKWLDVRAYPVMNESGELTRVIEHIRDITEIKKAEEENSRLQEKVRLAQKLESLGVLAGGIAHDFNNILVSVMGSADLALQDESLSEPVRSHLEDIARAAHQASDLAGKMLDYAGRNDTPKAALNMNDVVLETARLLRASVAGATELSFQLDDDLPLVMADPVQIRQVVMNLVINASEALACKNGTVVLETTSGRLTRSHLSSMFIDEGLPEGDYVSITVTDSGIGMDSNCIQRIFDPFYSTKFTGRGLGLATVLGTVRSHGGAVNVASAPGEGSVFTVHLPVYTGSKARRREPGASSETSFSGCVMLVDDEENVRRVSGMMLEKLGFSVIYAENGREAVELFKKNHGDLWCVILDLTMPVMDGAEALERIQEISPGARVLVSSGYSSNDIRRQLGARRPSGVLRKPYSLEDLAAALGQVMGG